MGKGKGERGLDENVYEKMDETVDEIHKPTWRVWYYTLIFLSVYL